MFLTDISMLCQCEAFFSSSLSKGRNKNRVGPLKSCPPHLVLLHRFNRDPVIPTLLKLLCWAKLSTSLRPPRLITRSNNLKRVFLSQILLSLIECQRRNIYLHTLSVLWGIVFCMLLNVCLTNRGNLVFL